MTDTAPFPSVAVRVHPRAARLTMRLDPLSGGVIVVVPPGIHETIVRAFVDRHADWIATRLARLPRPSPFRDGCAVPLAGEAVRVRRVPGLRGGSRVENGELLVGGGEEHLPRRVREFLVARAGEVIGDRAREKAASIGAKLKRVTLRDPRSRWGSCSADGRLSFSWRLVMAPDSVLDYVVAHEVAHLREMNHSPRFWKLCRSLTVDAVAARAWLKAEGGRLLTLGVETAVPHASTNRSLTARMLSR